MLSIQQGQSNMAFGNGTLRCQPGAVGKIKDFIDKTAPKEFGVLPEFLDKQGGLNTNLFVNHLRKIIDDVDFNGQYVLQDVRLSKGALKAKIVHQSEIGGKPEVFRFNPTYLFAKPEVTPLNTNIQSMPGKSRAFVAGASKLDAMSFSNDMFNYIEVGPKAVKQLDAKYSKNAWDA